MSTTTTGGIFTFDHGQKKMHNAIGVTEEYMEDLHEQVTKVLKNFLFTEDLLPREDASPSELVEACANEFSYSQLVIMSSYFLKSEVDKFGKKVAKFNEKLEGAQKIALNEDDLPEDFKNFLQSLRDSGKSDEPINGDDLPPGIKDFLDRIAREASEDDED
jgi:hypothetical protein